MTSHPFDAVFAGLFEPIDMGDLVGICVMSQAIGAPDVLFDKRERSAFILSASSYCQKCGHRQFYHDGGLGSCRYDGCGCTGYFAEAR